HGQQLVFEFGQLDLKMNTRQNSSPSIDCASPNVNRRRICAPRHRSCLMIRNKMGATAGTHLQFISITAINR
ncbi:MAG: hypothetical protein WB424_16145, partial [Terracidiphilus sp.]